MPPFWDGLEDSRERGDFCARIEKRNLALSPDGSTVLLNGEGLLTIRRCFNLSIFRFTSKARQKIEGLAAKEFSKLTSLQ